MATCGPCATDWRVTYGNYERCAGGCEVSEDGADRTVTELAKDFELALSTVSHHLKELRNAGLVICEKRGKQVYCRVNEMLLQELEAFMRDE